MSTESNKATYNDYALCWFPSFLVPPLEGGQEPPSEWLKVPIHYVKDKDIKFSIQNRCTFPHSALFNLCPVIILESDLTLIKWKGLEGYRIGKPVDLRVRELLKDSWNTEDIRCKDCPEWPWHILFRHDLIEFRLEDTLGEGTKLSDAVKEEMRGAPELQAVLNHVLY